jgi:imidazolonepropionase-like amidohydrolase
MMRVRTMTKRPTFASCALAALLAAGAVLSAQSGAPHAVHAITGARIVVSPGQVIARGTIVVRDGLIAAVGADVQPPPDARVWKGDDLTVYAGLIDALVLPPEPPRHAAAGAGGPGAPPRGPAPAVAGAVHELPSVRPERRVAEGAPPESKQVEGLRGAGFTSVHLAAREGIFRGTSAIVALGDGRFNQNLVVPDAAQVVALQPQRSGYPGSLMGAVAVVRQGFLDARWHRDALAAYAKAPGAAARPGVNVAWDALQPAVSGRQPVLFVADDMLMVLRAAGLAREAEVRPIIATAGDEYKPAGEIATAKVDLIVPVNFPEAPEVADEGDAVEVTTQVLRHWQNAPGNPAALARAGVTFALTANGLKDVGRFREQVALAVERGLPADTALAAVTTVPARLLGVGDRLGTIETGRIANLTVVRGGDLFARNSTVTEVWVDGQRYEAPKKPADGKNEGKAAGEAGATTSASSTPAAGSRPRTVGAASDAGKAAGTAAAAAALQPLVETPTVRGDPEAFRAAPPEQPAVVLVRNATVWTAGPQGTLQNADLLVRDGKVAAVGRGLTAPAGAVVIDGTGKHVVPGIIDAHSHAAILGNVNECTNSVTAEVRIADVVNSETVNMYQQLAGGTTMMHLLHGSCNAIGGQAAIIKNKWGAAPEQLLFPTPPTIKFALGENPKRAGGTDRYPRTRAGVEQTIRQAFAGARDYEAAWREYRAGTRPLPPRRDLQAEAVLEILDGKRLIHSHSYRADEILMLMRVAEEFGFTVQTFQHVLEGYKVADEMAAHGATASAFSDWWGYKFEVYDAIPYAGYLMWDRGVTVSFNSDSGELARRLNTEAAKAVKYGGVPPEEAITFVTLNPAIQLRIADRVGSLEVGKDADFSIWNGSPLSTLALCEQTWIEGRRYFDRAADLAGRAALEQERAELISRAKVAKKGGGGGERPGGAPTFRYLEATDRSGNDCGHGAGEAEHAGHEFVGEAERRYRQGGAQ